MSSFKLRALVFLLLFGSSGSSLSAAPPTIGDIEKQVQPPRQVEEQSNNSIPALPSAKSKTLTSDTSGAQIAVERFQLSGATHLPSANLLALLSPYEGKSYSFAELQAIIQLITDSYHDKGYFFARAYIPKQSMQDGVLEVVVIEGEYGSYQLNNSSLVSDKKINAIVNQAKAQGIVSATSLERAMLLINDTPGVNVSGMNFTPSAKGGSADLSLSTVATAPYSAYIIGDNYGDNYTGRYRLNLGVSAYSPFGYGDKLSVNGVVSTSGDLTNGAVSYGFPLLANGLRAELSASHVSYSLAKDYAYLDARGKATILSAKLSYPVIRTQRQNLKFSLGYTHRRMTDEINTTSTKIDKATDLASLEMHYNRKDQFFNRNLNTALTLILTHGKLNVKDAVAEAIDKAGAQTNGDFTKLYGHIEKALALSPRYTLTTSLQFQKTFGHKNLDGSEDLSLGGAYGVRAFPSGEESAENGYLLGLELFYQLPEYRSLNHRLSLFADTGYVKMADPIDTSHGRQLSDIGLGYQASYKKYFIKAQLARVIGGEDVTSEDRYHTKALIQLGWIY